MVFEINVGIIYLHFPVSIMARARRVDGGALLALRWRTHQIRAAFGHMSGYPEELCNILYLLTPLFWVVNMRITKVVD